MTKIKIRMKIILVPLSSGIISIIEKWLFDGIRIKNYIEVPFPLIRILLSLNQNSDMAQD